MGINSTFWRYRWVRYGLAVAAILASALLRWLLPNALAGAPYLAFYPAVVVAAVLGGVGPGLVTTVGSLLVVNFVFGNAGYIGFELMTRYFIWTVGGTGISVLAGRMHIARRQAEFEAEAARKSEEALRESEGVLRTVTDHTRVGLVMLDTDRRYVFVNNAYAEVLGLPTSDIVGRRVADVMGHVYDQISPRLDRAFAGERVNYELNLPGQGGARERYYAVTYEPRRGDGKVVGVIVVVVDITERKRGEEALRESEAQFRNLANAIPQLCWMANGDGWIFWYNQRWYEYTGTTPEQMEGWGWKSVHDPATLDAVLERWQGSIATGEPFNMVFPLRGSDGIFRPFLTRVMPIKDSRGQVVRWFGTNTDVTELRDAQEALRVSEERWATTLQSIGDAVISTDATGKIVFMNEVAQKLTGWAFADAKGKDLTAIFNIVQEVTRIRPENPVAKVLRSGEIVGLANHTALVRRDGTEIPINDSGAPIRNKNGEIEGVVLVFHDVSEQRRMEKVLRETDRLATTGRLAASIAHEIHNPLDVIGNILHLITHSTQEDETRDEARMASDELERLAQMTQQMLTFQRESSKPVPVQIKDVIENVLALYHRKLESAGIKIQSEMDSPEPLAAHPGELRQVFANLIGNAIEAVGRSRGKIRIRAYRAQNWRNGDCGLRVVVADNGKGIPNEVREKVFDPFFTTKGESGTGLGLWVTTGIISKYDGALRVRSTTRAGRNGTCFSVFFPITKANAAAGDD